MPIVRPAESEPCARNNNPTTTRATSKCTLPLTGKGVVDRIITNFGVLDVTHKGLHIVELAPGVTRDEMIAATDATIV